MLDLRSCWVDIGTRDYVAAPSGSRRLRRGENLTLLWKSQCNRRLHERVLDAAPDSSLTPTYFRSFLLRDVGHLTTKIKPTKAPNLGHPASRKTSVVRVKAYNSIKKSVSVMFTSYYMFGSGFLPLLALDEAMIRDLASMAKARERVYETRLNRNALVRAWDANKRHLKAISNPQALTNYRLRKEVTLRLDALLTMWSRGFFDPERSPHTGTLTCEVSLNSDSDEPHYPFWVVPTRDILRLCSYYIYSLSRSSG